MLAARERRLGDSNAHIPEGTSPLSGRRTAPVGASKNGRSGTRTPAARSGLYTASDGAPRPAGHLPWAEEGGVEPCQGARALVPLRTGCRHHVGWLLQVGSSAGPAARYAVSAPGESNPGNTHRPASPGSAWMSARRAGTTCPVAKPGVASPRRVRTIRTCGLAVPDRAL